MEPLAELESDWLGPGPLSKKPALTTVSLSMSSGWLPVQGAKSATDFGGGNLTAIAGGSMPCAFRAAASPLFRGLEPAAGLTADLVLGKEGKGEPGSV